MKQMNKAGNKYQRIDDNDGGAAEGIEIPTAAPISVQSGGQIAPENSFSVRVLFNEKTYEISNRVHEHSTVAELKCAIEEVVQMPVHRQRLIFNGKLLKPEEKTISSFKIENGFRIHLFPLPEAPPVPVTATAVPATSATSANDIVGQLRSFVNGPDRDSTVGASLAGSDRRDVLHFDPTIGQVSREVKLWCIILMFLSALTLFNNFSYVTSTGRFGVGILDSMVTVLDIFCSAAGLWVGNMGVRSVRTMELSDIQRYVSCLIVLAAFSIALRLAWVLDVILQVQQLVTESHKQAAGSGNGNSGSGEDQGGSDEGDGGDGGGDNDDKDGNGSSNEDVFYFDNDTHGGNNDGDEPHPLDSSLVLTFGIQAGIIAFICIFAWLSCVARARRLQTAVQNYGEAMQV